MHKAEPLQPLSATCTKIYIVAKLSKEEATAHGSGTSASSLDALVTYTVFDVLFIVLKRSSLSLHYSTFMCFPSYHTV